MVLKSVTATEILLEARLFKIICMIILKKIQISYPDLFIYCLSLFFVVLKQIQIVLKILTAAAILLAASLFKMVCIIISKKYYIFYPDLFIYYLYFCDNKVDTNCFENSDSCCNFVSGQSFQNGLYNNIKKMLNFLSSPINLLFIFLW